MSEFRLTVLNPGGRDPAQDFSQGTPASNDDEHAPVNFHAYAACTRGVFHRDVRRACAEKLPVLLLLRGDFKTTQRALADLKRARMSVAISFKETGLHQIARQLADPKRAQRFRDIVQAADDCLAATPDALAFYGRGEFIPTPYPIDDPRWNFSHSLSERRGVFIGTREWQTPSRHHLAALLLASSLGEPVTVFDENPKRARKFWRSLGLPNESLRLMEKRLPYRDYLAEMSRHKIVLQADKSAVPGQVAGDALLCRMPCVGGDGAIERLVFPQLCGFGRSLGELRQLAKQLLRDKAFYAQAIEQSQTHAQEKIAFAPVATQLANFFAQIAPR